MANGRFYITTPIYYVNARPHIGTVYTTTIADIIARYHRLRGEDVFFLTGTDEHGKKVADSAKEQGVQPQQFVDQISSEFQQAFARFQITNDDFIRTTQARHKTRAAGYIKKLIENGDVYQGEYEGWYDQGQEEYVTETNARTQDYKSAVSGKPLVRVKERNYFFRLSKYQQRLQEYIEKNPEFIQPDARRNEVLGRIREGLNDNAISRSTEPWGIPMPGDPEHSVYVWIDALFNYLTTVEANNRPDFWPADMHLIGKEILWFHAVVWPAILMALEIPLYHRLYAHSFWIREGQKMSKSLGNFIELAKIDEYVSQFSLDAFRYFLSTQGPMGTTDADFAHARFVEVYNTDLANTVGNCSSRITNMTQRYFGGQLPPRIFGYGDCDKWPLIAREHAKTVCRSFDKLQVGEAALVAMGLVRTIDAYIEKWQPFKLAKDPAKLPEVGTVLYNCAEAMRVASVLLWPFIPGKIEELWRRLGCGDYAAALANKGRGQFNEWIKWGQLKPGTAITHGEPIFPRAK